MKEIERFSVGLDVGKDSIHLCIKAQNRATAVSIKSTRKFGNNSKGWLALHDHLKRYKVSNFPHLVVIEATGVYYENIVYFLDDQKYEISVVLPKQSAYFAKASNQKSKNDKMDSKMLAQMGIEKFNALTRWTAPSSEMRELRQLTRFRAQLLKHSSQFRNQLHAVRHAYKPNSEVLVRLRKEIDVLVTQIKEVDKLIKGCVKASPEINEGVQNICTIKGFGISSAAILVAETFGFNLFHSIPQLVSYAGYDVIENQSGNRNGKTRISKKGNSRIRAALHYPALVAVRHSPEMAEFYLRIFEKNPKIKMIGYVAVQRKLLALAYILYKNNDSYNPDYQHGSKEYREIMKNRQSQKTPPTRRSYKNNSLLVSKV